jgi:glycine betaine catabolism B
VVTESVWQTSRIVRIVQQTPRIKSFFFELPKRQPHQPGQHYDVRLTAPDGYQAMRSYSIASAPDEGRIVELAIDRLDNGEVSNFFHDVAEIGDDIDLRGPLGGHFIWRPQDGGPVLLIGGGSGVVPLVSMIRTWHVQNSEVPIALLLSVSTTQQAPYLDELLAIAADKAAFLFRLALTREAPRRELDYGRRIDSAMVTAMLRALPELPRGVFICGSNGFANKAADSVQAAGVASTKVRTERYGG